MNRTEFSTNAVRYVLWGVMLGIAGQAQAQLDEHCTVSVLNRTAQVQPDGSWTIPNVPVGFGPVRVRVTCIQDNGVTFGQTDLVEVQADQQLDPGPLQFGATAIPESLTLATAAGEPTLFTARSQTIQLAVTARLPGGNDVDVTGAAAGTSYTTSNPAIASVDVAGLVTAVNGGTVLISALNEGALGVLSLRVELAGTDTDGDGVNDDVELANGMNPNDPADVFEDPDGDGLINQDEIARGTDTQNPDTDGDGLGDGQEVQLGIQPLVADSDGDGVPDGIEFNLGFDPASPGDMTAALAAALVDFQVAPSPLEFFPTAISGELSQALNVTGSLTDNASPPNTATIDLASTTTGTSYMTDNPGSCILGPPDGTVVAGADGSCLVTIANGSFQDTIGVSVEFTGLEARFVQIGRAENVDVQGDHAYVANGPNLMVVDATVLEDPLSDPNDALVGTVDTSLFGGGARDVKVVDDVAYVAVGRAGLATFDLSGDPASPVPLGALRIYRADAQDVFVDGSRAYLASLGTGLHIVDVSDPANPLLLRNVELPSGLGRGVAVSGELAVVAADSVVHVVDVGVRGGVAPAVLGSVGVGQAQDVVLDGGVALVASLSQSLTPIDLSVPSSPSVIVNSPPFGTADGGELSDVALSGTLAFGADSRFVTQVPVISVVAPADLVRIGFLDFLQAGEGHNVNGLGIALDEQFAYLVADHQSTFNNHRGLYFGRYTKHVEPSDGQPPTVGLTAPLPGAPAIGEGSTLSIRASAADDFAVAGVDFLVDGSLAFTDTTAPYEFGYGIPAGATDFTVQAIAVDHGGKSGVSDTVSVAVAPDAPPTVTLDVPTPTPPLVRGSTITLQAQATDDELVAHVEFSTDTGLVRTVMDPPYELPFAVPLDGGLTSITFEARARDRVPRETLDSIVVNLIADPGTTISGTVTKASDALPVEGAEVRAATSSGVSTDVNGGYVLVGAPTIFDTLRVTASKPTATELLWGWAPATPIAGGSVSNVDISLSPLAATRSDSAVGADPLALAIGDVDRDGILDVAVAVRGQQFFGPDSVAMLHGLGDGSFAAPVDVETILDPTMLALGDLNDDGFVDLVVGTEPAAAQGLMAVHLGLGNGAFGPREEYSFTGGPRGVEITDLDRDGIQDLIFAVAGNFHIPVFYGRGDGTYDLAAEDDQPIGESSQTTVTVGDIDGDGNSDMAMTIPVGSQTWLNLLFGSGGRNFACSFPIYDSGGCIRINNAGGQRANDIALADVDGDGDPIDGGDLDMVVATQGGVRIFLQTANRVMTAAATYDVGGSSTVVEVADLNHDGNLDVISVGAGDTVQVLLGNGDGTFQAAVSYDAGQGTRRAVLGDLNFSGLTDVVTVNRTAGDVSVLLNLGDGVLQSPSP